MIAFWFGALVLAFVWAIVDPPAMIVPGLIGALLLYQWIF